MSPATVRVVSFRTVPSPGKGVYMAPALYEARTRKSDGLVTWRCVDPAPMGHVRGRNGALYITGNRTERAAERSAERIAILFGLEFVYGIRHGQDATGFKPAEKLWEPCRITPGTDWRPADLMPEDHDAL